MARDSEFPTSAQVALLGAYPELSRVLHGEYGEDLQRELGILMGHAYPERSLRKVVRVVAKMIRHVAGLYVEDTVVVHDISESGMSVTIANHSNISLVEALAPVFLVRVVGQGSEGPSPREVRLSGRLVRIVASTDAGLVVAFRFENVSAEERQGLYDVVQWVTPKDRRASNTR